MISRILESDGRCEPALFVNSRSFAGKSSSNAFRSHPKAADGSRFGDCSLELDEGGDRSC